MGEDLDQSTWDDYADEYPYREYRDPTVYMIRHADTGAPLCVFKNSEDVDAWLDDFDDEADQFDVVSFPGKYPMLVLERGGQLFQTTEAQFQHACFKLRENKAFQCRLFYLSNDLDEKAMKDGKEEYLINQNWIRWWLRNDLPWSVDWDYAKDPDLDPPRLAEYDENGNKIEFDDNGDKIEYDTDDYRAWADPPPLGEPEMKELAMAMRAGTVFSSDHIPANQGSMIGSVFMVLMLGGRSVARSVAIHDFTFFYENLSEAGPRSINGMPCFFSVKMLTRKDHKRLYAKMAQIEKALADV